MAVLDETPGLVVKILADHVPQPEYEYGSQSTVPATVTRFVQAGAD